MTWRLSGAHWAVLFCLAAAWSIAGYASPIAPEDGFDYRVVASPQGRSVGKKVPVLEFFWYDCPHCNAMMPLIEPWARERAGAISFVRVPVARNPGAILQQRLYYALETLGWSEKLHAKIFDAIHRGKTTLHTLDQMADFVSREGVDRQAFVRAFDSPAVSAKVLRAQALTAQYGVDLVPVIAVDGRYVTSAAMLGGTQGDALRVADFLVNKAMKKK